MKNFKQKVTDNTHKDRALHAPSVTEYMVRHLITFKKDTHIDEVIDTLLEKRITGAPVLDDHGRMVGLIDDKDCLKVIFGGAYYNYPAAMENVETYMSQVHKSISTNETVVDAANIFLQTTYKRLQVHDEEGRLVGQVSRRDILKAIKDMKKQTW